MLNFFEIKKRDTQTKARLGVLTTAHGAVHTPAFLPIGTRGVVKAVTSEELKFWGAEMVLCNTYHLWLRPGDLLVRKSGGLHKFMAWDGPIFTDSGGYQVFSMGEKLSGFPPARGVGGEEEGVRESDGATPSQSPPTFDQGRSRGRNVVVSSHGVEFQDELGGDKHLLTPEESINIQANLGSDIALVLHDVPGLPATTERLGQSLTMTLEWAARAKREHEKLVGGSVNPGQKLYGIVQGGDDEKLRGVSAAGLREIGFDGYAIGGLAVGESPEVMYKVLDFTVPQLEAEKPRHLLGVGTPEQIFESVALGCDTFDCVLPTRNARHGQLFINDKSGGYVTINIENAQYAEDFTPPDNTCSCYLCLRHTRAYLRHLFAAKEPLGIRLATMHNLRFYLDLMSKVRRALEFDSFAELLDSYRKG